MTFAARTRAQIRDTLLADWAARYQQQGKTLLTITGSPAYMEAEAIALQLEGLEAQAAQTALDILPDKASTDALTRHGIVEGVARRAATYAVLVVEISGNPSTTVTFGSSVMVSTAGIRYTPSGMSVGLDGAGKANVTFTAQTAGVAGNQAYLTVLTWSSTPVNANPTGTVQSTTTAAQDAETDASYALRIIQRRQERPASGNRADWRDWARTVSGVSDAYVWPLLHPSLGVNTLGAVTVTPIGPAQGDSTTNTQILSGSGLTNVAAYIEGTKDSSGADVALAQQKQLRPVTMAVGDYSIEAPTTVTQNVDVTAVMATAYAFPWSGTMTVDGSSTSTSLVVTGDQRSLADGKPVLVNVGTGNIRGAYQKISLGSGSFGGGNTTWTVQLSGTPTGTVYPAPPNWSSIRTAVFAYFDNLGPGDTTPACRWPSPDVQGRSVLYRSALAAVFIDGYTDPLGAKSSVPGVLSASVGTPGGDVTPAAKQIVTLGTLLVHA